ncbi:MAG: aminotransferase class I/II-fold pyridoxal phosphate-dependent enzyme [Clostridia bacterium]|nr:aminotransferase class I/II-fold pyridoxal phosphate-dependent enzyme [Clostridia bacterium]
MDFNVSVEELQTRFTNLKKKYAQLQREKFSLDISRGKPCAEQLDIAMPLLTTINGYEFDKPDYRNYGFMDGIPELKKVFADVFQVSPDNVFLGGCSSLNLMYDVLSKAWCFGVLGGTPWCKLPKVKFICPVPGYDRHFSILEQFGIEMISVPMKDDGPDMDLIEDLVANDIYVKGIFCVPRFSNPTGIVFSDEVVRRLATMKTAAVDFRIFWDNAYCVHALYPDAPALANIFTIPDAVVDRVYMFASTSKITFSSGGTCCMVTSDKNYASLKKMFSIQTINFDKINQLEHALFLKDASNVAAIMEKHAQILRPKFEAVLSVFEQGFAGNKYVSWTKPKGGYFITLTVMNGTAKKVVEMCKRVGLTLTDAGATHPLHIDDLDSTIRIAPSYATLEDIIQACKVLVTVVDFAICEQLLS